MEKGGKKTCLVCIALLCLICAVAISFSAWSNGSRSLNSLKGQLLWVKCGNPDCGSVYQMDKKEFYVYVHEHQDPEDVFETLPLPCKKCSQLSIYKAVKCEKCGNIFFEGIAGTDDYSDRCPECAFSKTEQLVKTHTKR